MAVKVKLQRLLESKKDSSAKCSRKALNIVYRYVHGHNTELSNIAKLSVFESVFVPILTYGHGSWVMTEKVLSQIQAEEMGFLRRVHDVTFRNKVRSCSCHCIPVCLNISISDERLLLRMLEQKLYIFDKITLDIHACKSLSKDLKVIFFASIEQKMQESSTVRSQTSRLHVIKHNDHVQK